MQFVLAPGGLTIATLVLAAAAGVFALILSLRLVRLVFCLLRRVLRFARDVVRDTVRTAASLCAACILLPLLLVRAITGNVSAAGHYGRALETELAAAGRSLYRILLVHPAALIGLRDPVGATGRRLERAVDRAPRTEAGAAETDALDGYVIEGTLATGGSGARLYVARPGRERVDAWRKAGRPVPDRVVIKLFRLDDGSNLPQIVRESRALEAARNLGLVLEHGIDENRFFYIMPYVPGEDLGAVAARMHAHAGPEGLDNRALGQALGYVADLLATLDRYHHGGLWHKDVKPENVIVSGGRAFLVDLGLVTPLRSGMTLTTHGTEYYRDPELVRAALRGAKVSEVDGVRFDLYGVGAVLYSLVEGSFPAHGSLSQITRRCPETLRWIIRRSMADLDQRYGSAGEMLADVEVVRGAEDPFALRPADLPSMTGAAIQAPPPPPASPADGAVAYHAASYQPLPAIPPSPPIPPVPPPVPERAPIRLRRRRRSRRPGPMAAVAALLLLSLLGLAFMARISAPSSATLSAEGARIPSAGERTIHIQAGPGEPDETLVFYGGSQVAHAVAPAPAGELPALDLREFHTTFRSLADLEPRRTPPAIALVEDASLAGGDDREAVEDLCDRLGTLGFEVLGDPRDTQDAQGLDLLATLRRDFTASDLGDEEAGLRLDASFRADRRLRALLRIRRTARGEGWDAQLYALQDPAVAPLYSTLKALASGAGR